MFSTIAQRSQNLVQLQRYYAAKQLLFGSQARKQLLQGCRQLSNAVQVTLGPGGRNVLIDQSYGSPKITKDGVTVAKAVELPDKAVNIGATLVKNVANKANDVLAIVRHKNIHAVSNNNGNIAKSKGYIISKQLNGINCKVKIKVTDGDIVHHQRLTVICNSNVLLYHGRIDM